MFGNLWFFHLSRRTTIIQDLLVRRQFSLVSDKRTARPQCALWSRAANSFLARYAGGLYKFPFEAYLKIKFWKFSNSDVLLKLNILVLIKINYGQIGDQTGLFYTTNPVFYTSGNRFVHRTGMFGNLWFFHLEQESLRNAHVKIIGYQFGTKFKLVFCAKYDRGLDLGFWEILKPLKWTNCTSFFLIVITHICVIYIFVFGKKRYI
jgi:hypothetical protein